MNSLSRSLHSRRPIEPALDLGIVQAQLFRVKPTTASFASGFSGIWLVVKSMVPFWVLSIIRHYYLGDPEGDHNFDNHPYETARAAPVLRLRKLQLPRGVLRDCTGSEERHVPLPSRIPKTSAVPRFRSPHRKNHRILGFILGSPIHGHPHIR